jgi:hypothetical protein
MRIPVMANPTKLKLRATAKNTMKIAETMVDVVLSLSFSLLPSFNHQQGQMHVKILYCVYIYI